MIENENAGVRAIVEQVCAMHPGVCELPKEDAVQLLRSVSDAHGIDEFAYHWWEVLRESRSFHYGNEVSEWYERMRSLLMELGQYGLYMAVTDDEPPPWTVLAIEPDVPLLDIIGELQYFEYFVFSRDCARVVFDTHDNVLIASP